MRRLLSGKTRDSRTSFNLNKEGQEQRCDHARTYTKSLPTFSTKEEATRKMVGVSYTTIFKILHDNLGMTKVDARWMTRIISQKSHIALSALCKVRFDFVNHPPYSSVQDPR